MVDTNNDGRIIKKAIHVFIYIIKVTRKKVVALKMHFAVSLVPSEDPVSGYLSCTTLQRP